MKKLFAMIMTIAILTTAVTAIAEGKGGPMGGPQQGQTQPGPQPGGNGPQGQAPRQMQGDKGQQPPEKPSDDNGQQAPEKPGAAPEKPAGEKPADAPEEPEDLTGDRPALLDDAQEQQAPEKPAEGQAPTDGQAPSDAQHAPGTDIRMIDFDAMVTSGVISQETGEKIKAYMDAHKPEGAPTEGQQAPTDGQQPPEKPAGGQMPDLLSELLSEGVITQAEYDALTAAQTAA